MTLSFPKEPFPVRIPFKTSADMYKLGKPLFGQAEDTIFCFDTDFEKTIEEKLRIFRDYPEHSNLYVQDDLSNLQTTYWRIIEALANEQSEFVDYADGQFHSKLLGFSVNQQLELAFDEAGTTYPELGKRCYDYLVQQSGIDRLALGLALSMQEDFVVMRNDTGEYYADIAEALIVALPTHWIPKDKLGQDFGTIHHPVGDNEMLIKAHPRLVKAMIEKGPFYRYNWSLSSVESLCQNTALLNGHSMEFSNLPAVDNSDELLDLLYFRSERQTMLNLPDLNRGIFFIRIYQRPLQMALKSTEHAQKLADAIESMTEAQQAYRSMTQVRDMLIAGLRARSQELLAKQVK